MRKGRSLSLREVVVADWRLISLVAVAFMFGGGGVGTAIWNFIVQAFAFGLLLFSWPQVRERWARLALPVKILLIATCALPAIQLLPLPPNIWSQLPGRDLVYDSLAVIGAEGEWRPFTVDRVRTAVALMGLATPLAALMLVRTKSSGFGTRVLQTIVIAALANFVFGGLQISAGTSLNPYPVLEQGRLYGFFANHNSSGLFFVLGLCALLGLAPGVTGRYGQAAVMAIGAILILGTLLTNSRSSTTLLLVPLSYAAALYSGVIGKGRKFAPRRLGAIGGAVVLGVALLFVAQTRVERTWERFAALEDSRTFIWEDASSAAGRYWPVGSGMGTLDEVFQVEESLETLQPGHARRAHNEYLEVTVEAGIVGLFLIIAWGGLLLYMWWTTRASGKVHWADGVGLALLCIALQSIVDYPMRNQALLCVAGLLVALLVGALDSKKDKSIAA